MKADRRPHLFHLEPPDILLFLKPELPDLIEDASLLVVVVEIRIGQHQQSKIQRSWTSLAIPRSQIVSMASTTKAEANRREIEVRKLCLRN